MSVIKPNTIENKTGHKQSSAQDFAYLRQHAIDLIQQMAGDKWTDYNLHDPGVTILEQVCYAITDLAYRTDVPIEDLLADKSGHIDFKQNSFYKRDEILFSSPVTINDFRKVLIDEIPEIDNIWLYPFTSVFSGGSIHGVYRTIVQVNSAVATKLVTDKDEELRIIGLIKSAFMTRRNLCEDLYDEITILKPVSIEINADVLIKDQYQPEQVLAEIYAEIEKLLSAKVTFYTEDELLAQGYTIEEIYSGPKLNNGIVPDSELKERHKEIDPAGISHLITKVNGVLQVKQISIKANNSEVHNKPFNLDNGTFPVLSITNPPGIKLATSKFQVQIRQSVFLNLLTGLNASFDKQFISAFYKADSLEITGHYRDTKSYYSIQNNFPIIYGIGKEGIPLAVRTTERVAQARQLKAYLLFFEQILANYLMLLTNIEDSFSYQLPDKDTLDNYNQPLYDITGIRYLLKAYTDLLDTDENIKETKNSDDEYWKKFKNNKNNAYRKALSKLSETAADYQKRKHMQLDHMLARFNEPVIDYPVRLFKQLYKPEQEETYITDEIKWKSYILNNIASLNYGRTRGYNFLEEKNDKPVFNFEKRIQVLLCIANNTKEKLLTESFNDKKITIEPALVAASSNTESYSTGEDILLPDAFELFFTREQTEQLVENDNINTNNSSFNGIRFNNRTETLFMEAIVISNYRIAPNVFYGDKTGFTLLFKYPDEAKWQIISNYSNETDAVTSFKKIVKYFRQISIDSEGLYAVEHILLRPPMNSESYKFRFITKNGEVLFELKDWVSFEEREQLIGELRDTVQGQNTKAITDYLSKNCLLPSSGAQPVDTIIKNIRNFFIQPNHHQRFEMLVKAENDTFVTESFFSFQITIVLPSWPARFQDNSFQEFLKSLITLNVPAHIKVNFKWLSVSKMKVFEDLYVEFKKFFKEDDVTVKQQIANKLITFFQSS